MATLKEPARKNSRFARRRSTIDIINELVPSPAPVRMRSRRVSMQPPMSSPEPLIILPAITLPPPKKREERLITIFYRILRLVRVLCRVCIIIRRYALNKSDSQVIFDVQQFLRPRVEENITDLLSESICGVYFNKKLYSVDSTHRFPLWARRICNKRPHDRNGEELRKLCKYLRGIPAFSQFGNQIEICRSVIYSRFDKMRVLLSQGDDAEYFYIMLDGTVFINISTMDSNTGIEISTTVDILQKHQAFGGNALAYGAKRTATVVAATFVEVLLIDSHTFQEYCRHTILNQIETGKQFLEAHKVFHTWSSRKLKLLSYDVKTKFYRSGKIIERDVANSMYVYFIMAGAVDVIYWDRTSANKWLYSDKLKRPVGILGGNRISAPQTCGLKVLFDKEHQNSKAGCCLISHNATILYLPKVRFRELCPKDFLSSYEESPSFRYLSDRDYEFERSRAVRWMEYRKQTARESYRPQLLSSFAST